MILIILRYADSDNLGHAHTYHSSRPNGDLNLDHLDSLYLNLSNTLDRLATKAGLEPFHYLVTTV